MRLVRASAVAATTALFAPFAWLLATRRLLTQFDLAQFNLPVRHLYREALRSGDSILWTPAVFAGFYVHGDGQGGAAHPLHLVLYRFLPLDVAFNFELTVSYVAAFAGMFLLQRRLGLSRDAAILGALLFAFGGFSLLHLNHMNAVAVMAHAPWMLSAVDAALRQESLRRALRATVVFAALLGSQLLIGYPQYVWFSLLACAAFALIRMDRPIRLLLLPAGVVAGALAGAVQLLPTFDAMSQSYRAGMGHAFTLSYSLHPLNLVQLWSPYAYANRVYHLPGEVETHEFAIYNGAFSTIAVVWLLMRRRDLGSRGPLVVGLLICAAVSILLALGAYGGVDRLMTYLPIVGAFRAPARHIALVQLFLSLLAGIAFDDLMTLAKSRVTWSGRRLWPLGILAGLGLVTLAAASWLGATRLLAAPLLEWSSTLRASAGLAIVIVTSGLVVLCAKGVSWAPATLILIAAADLGAWGWPHAWRPPPESLAAIVDGVDVPSAAAPPEMLFEATRAPAANLPVLRGFRMFNGYVALWPVRVLDVEDPIAQRLGGVHWQHAPDGWHPVQGSMPRARLVSDVRVSADVRRDIHEIAIARTALIDRPLGTFGGEPGDAQLIVDAPGRITILTRAPARQLLVLTERFQPGWRATSDGVPLDVLRAYGDQVAVPVDSGVHRLELRFAPASARVGTILTGLGCLVLASAFLALGRGPRIKGG
jgi:hypothetical protein